MLPTQSRRVCARRFEFASGDLGGGGGHRNPGRECRPALRPDSEPRVSGAEPGAREAGRQRVSRDARRGEREKGTWGVGRGSDGEYRNLGVS